MLCTWLLTTSRDLAGSELHNRKNDGKAIPPNRVGKRRKPIKSGVCSSCESGEQLHFDGSVQGCTMVIRKRHSVKQTVPVTSKTLRYRSKGCACHCGSVSAKVASCWISATHSETRVVTHSSTDPGSPMKESKYLEQPATLRMSVPWNCWEASSIFSDWTSKRVLAALVW